jgi:prepilin-type N-terminal cleavage/methylation domain-containing protein
MNHDLCHSPRCCAVTSGTRVSGPQHSRAWQRAAGHRPAPPRSNGFSLIEVLVVVALLSVIILGLMAMFGQTQRAFRAGVTQTDVLESGRAVMDMIARDFEKIVPAYSDAQNFYAVMPGNPYTPLLQTLPGSDHKRTNLMLEVFCLGRENRAWHGIGYRISNPDQGVGTLYRYWSSLHVSDDPIYLFDDRQRRLGFSRESIASTNFHRIVDGIIHFRIRAYDTNGTWITPFVVNMTPSFQTNVIAEWSNVALEEVGFYQFTNQAVPAFVEFELGILEPRALERFKSIPTAAAKRQYLENQAARVHLFRQRVPIRNVDPSAYQ